LTSFLLTSRLAVPSHQPSRRAFASALNVPAKPMDFFDPLFLFFFLCAHLSTEQRELAFTVLNFVYAEQNEERRRALRFYLTRADLVPNPRVGSAWQFMYAGGNDRAFITTMGFDTTAFHLLLKPFKRIWDTTPIPRGDLHPESSQIRLSKRSLDAAGALGLVLHYLNSTMADYTLQQIFGLTPAVCSRYRNFGMKILLQTLCEIPEGSLAWPKKKEIERFAKLIRTRHPLLTHGFGFVDGLHLPIAKSQSLEVENAYYNGWCSSHFTSNLFAFAPDGTIIHATVNAPGSWHDSAISTNLYTELIDNTPEGYYLIADTAFTTTRADLAPKLRTPPKKDFVRYSCDPRAAMLEIKFYEQLVSARQAAEWGMQCLQGSFGRLKMPMPADDAQFRQLLIMLCARLHNARARIVGINQIRTVYEGIWTEAGPGVYKDFKNLMFSDIRKNDRIRRFYNFVA
jgi:hypothetical protein